jgi:hypothetical protein
MAPSTSSSLLPPGDRPTSDNGTSTGRNSTAASLPSGDKGDKIDGCTASSAKDRCNAWLISSTLSLQKIKEIINTCPLYIFEDRQAFKNIFKPN